MTAAMFIAGVRKLNRVRGDGWLDCPRCGEHAAQDVVDEMRFLALSFYRFTPVGRRRVLICRRCEYRRPASAEEMKNLRTVSRGIARAWLVPMGLSPFLVVLLVALALAARSELTSSGVSFTDVRVDPIAPATIKLPVSYNRSAIPDDEGGALYVSSDPAGILIIRLRHYPVNDTPENVLSDHFRQDVGISANGFPDSPPKGDTKKIADVDAIHVTAEYLSQGAKAELTFYAFNKDGNAYILSFQQLGDNGIKEANSIEDTVVGSLSFTGKPTPAPSPSPSPGASESPGATTTTTATSTTSTGT